jgi:hypothetical protein
LRKQRGTSTRCASCGVLFVLHNSSKWLMNELTHTRVTGRL